MVKIENLKKMTDKEIYSIWAEYYFKENKDFFDIANLEIIDKYIINKYIYGVLGLDYDTIQ